MFESKMRLGLAVVGSLFATAAVAQEVPIVGTVESKCVVQTEVMGVYGNPQPSVLSTNLTDGGVLPVVRFDVIQASYYYARITAPNSFSESPALDDVVNWTSEVSVAEVTDAGMSAYDSNKIEYDNVTEIPLTIAGSTWFKIDSQADYGFEKAFPAGTYRTVVGAECIAI